MTMSFLNEENCNLVESANNKMKNVPEEIRKCAATFRKGMEDENIASLFGEAKDGNKIHNNLNKYCDSMEQMANAIERLSQTLNSLVLNSRRAIRTGSEVK